MIIPSIAAALGTMASGGAGKVQPAGVGEAVAFRETDYLTQNGTITASDSEEMTLSFWLTIPDGNTGYGTILSIYDNTDTEIANLGLNSSKGFYWVTKMQGNEANYSFVNFSNDFEVGVPTHILFSFKAGDFMGFTVNGTIRQNQVPSAAARIEFSRGIRTRIGTLANTATGSYLNGIVTDIWMDNTFVDPRVQANVDKFIDPDGKRVDLGLSGTAPTGSQPLIFFGGTQTSLEWNQGANQGRGGDFTLTGNITNSLFPRPKAFFTDSNRILSRTGNLGLTAGDKPAYTFSAWVRTTVNSFAEEQALAIFYGSSTYLHYITYNSQQRRIRWFVKRPDTGNILIGENAANNTLLGSEMAHVMLALDQTSGYYGLYINDTLIFESTSLPADLVFQTDSLVETYIGGGRTDNVLLREFYLYQYYFTMEFIDPRVEANRRKFVTENGGIVDLGSIGSVPTGNQPLIFFSGLQEENEWFGLNNNLGTGGYFTSSQSNGIIKPFEGNSYMLNNTNLGFPAGDSQTMTIAMHLKAAPGNSPDETLFILYGATSWLHAINYSPGAQRIQHYTQRPDGTTLINDGATIINNLLRNTDAHVIFALDRANNYYGLWVNDTPVLERTSFSSEFVFFRDSLTHAVIGSSDVGANEMTTQLYQVYFTDEFVDPRVEANRRKFFTTDGKAVDLGVDGSLPTGNQPAIFLSAFQTESQWNSEGGNLGFGGDFIFTPDGQVLMPALAISNGTRDVSGGSGTATAGLIFNDNGSLEVYANQTTGTDNLAAASDFDGVSWYRLQNVIGIGSNYEIFVNSPTVTSGAVGGSITQQPTLNTWIDIASPLFEITNTGNSVESTYTVEWVYSIRSKATGRVLIDNQTIRLNAILFGL